MPRTLLTAGVPEEPSAHVRPVDKIPSKHTNRYHHGGCVGKRTGLWETLAGKTALRRRKEEDGEGGLLAEEGGQGLWRELQEGPAVLPEPWGVGLRRIQQEAAGGLSTGEHSGFKEHSDCCTRGQGRGI